jgi:excisionase family DNA binding protein
MEQLYSKKEASDKLRLAPSTLYRFIHEGAIECNRLGSGNRIRFTEKQLNKFVSRQTEKGDKK